MPYRTHLHLVVRIAMSFVVSYNFIRDKGKEKLEKIKEISNRKSSHPRGKRKVLKEIAEVLGVSVQRASKLRSQVLVQEWVYSEETLDALKLLKEKAKHEIKEIDELTESNILNFKEKRTG